MKLKYNSKINSIILESSLVIKESSNLTEKIDETIRAIVSTLKKRK